MLTNTDKYATITFMKLLITFFAVILFLLSIQTVFAKPHEFSVLDYNQALTQYDAKQYALAYNTLLDSNAPISVIKVFFP